VIYFAQADPNGPVKIGYTTSLTSRLKRLSCHARKEIVAVATKPGSSGEEKFLHARFAAYRTRGPTGGVEWFLQSRELAILIKDLGGELRGPFADPIQRPRPASDGVTLLRAYISKAGLTPGGASIALGCSIPTLFYIFRGKHHPSDTLAKHIEIWTDMAVPARSWLELDGIRFRDGHRQAWGLTNRPDAIRRRAEALRSKRQPVPYVDVVNMDESDTKSALRRAEEAVVDARFDLAMKEHRAEMLRHRVNELQAASEIEKAF
jgi:hypothetical protein